MVIEDDPSDTDRGDNGLGTLSFATDTRSKSRSKNNNNIEDVDPWFRPNNNNNVDQNVLENNMNTRISAKHDDDIDEVDVELDGYDNYADNRKSKFIPDDRY